MCPGFNGRSRLKTGVCMERCDIKIVDGTVVDGTGAPGYRGDLALIGDTIVACGDCDGWQAEHSIDAKNCIVAPGFIDVHTHDDVAALNTPQMPFKVTQGVTSIVAGNCGLSAAPLAVDGDLPPPFTLLFLEGGGRFRDVATYRTALETARPAVNLGLLVGHGSLRLGTMGTDLARAATEAEVARMQKGLDRQMRQGALGLSSGLEYPPAIAATIDEMVPLARQLRAFPGAIYTTHMRDEGDGLIASVRETLETGLAAGVGVVISHHKCSGEQNFGKSIQTLAMIKAARANGPVGLDVYPYDAGSTALLPEFTEDCREVKIMWSRPHPEMNGRLLDDIAADWGVSRATAIDRLNPAGAIYFSMDEADVRRIIAFPGAMIGSDGIPGSEKPHPRLWGTFPRVLGHYCRELRLLSLAQAVHKMTGLSAQTFGLTDRGVLAVGNKADITIFDAKRVIDRATYDDPEAPAEGITHVLVNGQVALENGAQTGVRAGGFLRH